MDLQMPDMNGLDAMISIRSEISRSANHHPDHLYRDVQVLRASKRSPGLPAKKIMLHKELLETIRAVHAGRKSLSAEVSYQLASTPLTTPDSWRTLVLRLMPMECPTSKSLFSSRSARKPSKAV